MSEEIKEILNEMKEIYNVWVNMNGKVKSYTQDEIHCIYDYITNLQQKVEQLESIIKEATDLLKEAGCYDEETKQFCDDVWGELPDLLNILNKGSESDE